ncbi:MAG: ABC transporter permease [Polyangiaceae bacterium]|nr:ABC transporter permease [Polyangiaceae bacterium]
MLAILGVAVGVAALLTVMSVTGGFQKEFREKVLGVNAHVLVLKYSTDFREYRDVMEIMEDVPGIIGIAPFTINPMMVSHKDKTATGVLVKGVDPTLMPTVLDLPNHIVPGGSLEGLRRPGSQPPERKALGIAPPSVGGGKARKALIPESPEKSGGEARDKLGRNLTLLRAIEDQIREDTVSGRRDADTIDSGTADAGENDDDGSSAVDEILAIENAPDNAVDNADEHATVNPVDEVLQDTPKEPDFYPPVEGEIVGSVEPEGGYQSTLPDPDDDLPDDIAPDPCNSAESRESLPGIVIGATLAKNLSARLGDCLQVTSPTIGYSYSGGVIRPPVAKQFKVIAVFDAGFDQYDSKLVYVDLFEAQRFQDFGDSVTGVEAKIVDIDNSKAIKKQVASKLSPTLYSTMDWEDLNRGLFTALRIQKIGMSAVLALIIFVAAFTVVATLIMLVLDKQRDIAVLKAMGATDVAILRTFLYRGGIIGVVGTALGLVLGFATCKGLLVYAFPLDPKVYFIPSLPVEVRPVEFIVTGAIALTLCLVATVVPSLYAAHLRPADGLRPG